MTLSGGESVARALGELELDPSRVERAADAVLAEELYWFPVRHHSPTVARHLAAVLEARRPKLVLIEGPSEASDLIDFVTDAKTRPPIAIYSSYRDDDDVLGYRARAGRPDAPPFRTASLFPLVQYSPEYVALVTAKRLGAAATFIDLPHHAELAAASGEAAKARETAPPEEPAADASAGPAELAPREDDRLFAESGFFRHLASAAGFRSWDEAWDSLFEIEPPERDPEAYRRKLAIFCAAVRMTTDPKRLAGDGTLERERFMRRAVERELASRKLAPRDAVVVCGGFHLFLDRNDDTPPPEPPHGTVYTTVMPYSFFRISELSGYAAGNRAPQFYQTRWEHGRAADGREAGIRHIVEVLTRARKNGELVSSADAIAATQTAGLLAELRGRPEPVLDDIRDAIVTCCVKGDPAREGERLMRALTATEIGTKVGRVTPVLGRLPLLSDFYARIEALGLDEIAGKEGRLKLDLDKRKPEDQERSTFLHRLRFLEVPIGVATGKSDDGLQSGRLFHERWALKWDPGIEPALIELSLLGDSVETAAMVRLSERLLADEQSAEVVTGRLLEAVEMDFPDLVDRVERLCGPAIDNDSRFTSLCHALTNLLVLDRYADFRKLRRETLHDLIERCFSRGCFALSDASAVPDEQQPKVVNALLGLAEALSQSRELGVTLDRELFVQSLRHAIEISPVPYLRGAFEGMLTELRAQPNEALAEKVGEFARETPERMIPAGDYVDGVMSVSRSSILLGADALLGALDELLRAADWDAFLTMLPRLRGAFERLHARQRDSLASRVAERYGLTATREALALHTSIGAATAIARIDARVRDIMKGWDFT